MSSQPLLRGTVDFVDRKGNVTIDSFIDEKIVRYTLRVPFEHHLLPTQQVFFVTGNTCRGGIEKNIYQGNLLYVRGVGLNGKQEYGDLKKRPHNTGASHHD